LVSFIIIIILVQ